MKKSWDAAFRLLAAAGLGLALASSAVAAPVPDSDRGTDAAPVKAELLTDGSAVVPGKPFKVGGLFHVAPGFHIYWKNPGDAGLATAVKFNLPNGFAAGDLQWPLPKQFVQPGSLIGYGYEDAVMLTAEVTPPAKLGLGEDEWIIRGSAKLQLSMYVVLGADVSWLSCRKICMPGKAELSAKLPVATQSEPANEALFAEWAARMPLPVRSLAEIGGAVRIALVPRIQITVPWKTKPEKVEFFPAPPEDVLLDKVAINTTEKQTVIAFAARRSGAAGPAESIECVVAYTLPDGARKGFPARIPLPVLSAPPAAK